MKRWSISYIVLLACLVSIQACATPPLPPDPLSVELVIKDSLTYQGKAVTVHAVAEPHRHGINLTDCASSVNAIALVIPEKVESNADVAELLDHVYMSWGQGRTRKIEADFVGVYEVKQGEIPSRVLRLQAVENIVVWTVQKGGE